MAVQQRSQQIATTWLGSFFLGRAYLEANQIPQADAWFFNARKTDSRR
jgi:hypothetical protein